MAFAQPPKIQLSVDRLGMQGDGIARWDNQAVYIEGALAGEVVEVSISQDKQGVLRGRLLSVIDESPDRQSPPCIHYEICGGCSTQHLNQTAYQQWTTDKIHALFDAKEVKPRQWLDPIFIFEQTRRRVTFVASKVGGKVIIGYNQRRSHQFFDAPKCLLPELDLMQLRHDLLPYLERILPHKKLCDVFIQKCDNGFDVCLTGLVGAQKKPDLTVLETAADMVRALPIIRLSWRLRDKDEPEVMLETAKPYVMFGDLSVPVPPLGFLQPSMAGQAALMDVVRNAIPNEIKKAADLFSGCGTFTGVLRQGGMQVDAFEGEEQAITALKSAGHHTAFKRDLFQNPLTGNELDAYDLVVIDPPRAGAKAQSEMLADSSVRTIIAVSCNPATFVRDAQILMDGGYVLEIAQIVDQFIWSDHVELVGVFARK